MGWVVEQAGGKASTGAGPMLEEKVSLPRGWLSTLWSAHVSCHSTHKTIFERLTSRHNSRGCLRREMGGLGLYIRFSRIANL